MSNKSKLIIIPILVPIYLILSVQQYLILWFAMFVLNEPCHDASKNLLQRLHRKFKKNTSLLNVSNTDVHVYQY